MNAFYDFMSIFAVIALWLFTLYVVYVLYKGVDALLKFCIASKHCFDYEKEKTDDIEDYFTLGGRLEHNKLFFNLIKKHFKILFTKKGWKKYENYWNSRS